MKWVKTFLYDLKIIAIILIVLATIILWVKVPEEKLKEKEVSHASKSSK